MAAMFIVECTSWAARRAVLAVKSTLQTHSSRPRAIIVAEKVAAELLDAPAAGNGSPRRSPGLVQAYIGDEVVRAEVGRPAVGQTQDDVCAFDP